MEEENQMREGRNSTMGLEPTLLQVYIYILYIQTYIDEDDDGGMEEENK